MISVIWAIVDMVTLMFCILVLSRLFLYAWIQLLVGRRRIRVRSMMANIKALMVLQRIYLWVLPFSPWFFLARGVLSLSLGHRTWVTVVDFACAAIWFWIWKRDGDDRWKKIRKKLKEKVAVNLDGRLEVQPSV